MSASSATAQPVTPTPPATPPSESPAKSPQPATPAPSPRELFPGVRADPAAKTVEFDAEVIADRSDPKKIVYLEVLACPRDTKEHESLVMTMAKPSQVHAALLVAGFVPGKPVEWVDTPKPADSTATKPSKPTATPPTGDAINVEFIWRDGTAEHRASPLEWVINAKDKSRASDLNHGFVFAGSVLIRTPSGKERYDADAAGTLIGLASFGSETIAWTKPFSPESAIDEPIWIIDRDRLPKFGTKVTVRLSAGEGKAEQPQNAKPD